jgi:hypothetical protein
VALITQSEYARRRGVAKSAVAKAVKESRIRLIDGLIDPDVADIQWERNTRARADSAKPPAAAGAPGVTSTGAGRALLPIEAAAASGTSTSPGAPAAASQPPDPVYSVDRARREKFEADMAEIRLAEARGDLVNLAAVRVEIANRVGQLRANLLQLPARLAPLLANESDQARCHALLDGELRAVLTDIVDPAPATAPALAPA